MSIYKLMTLKSVVRVITVGARRRPGGGVARLRPLGIILKTTLIALLAIELAIIGRALVDGPELAPFPGNQTTASTDPRYAPYPKSASKDRLPFDDAIGFDPLLRSLPEAEADRGRGLRSRGTADIPNGGPTDGSGSSLSTDTSGSIVSSDSSGSSTPKVGPSSSGDSTSGDSGSGGSAGGSTEDSDGGSSGGSTSGASSSGGSAGGSTGDSDGGSSGGSTGAGGGGPGETDTSGGGAGSGSTGPGGGGGGGGG
jgi:hypothetical protein